MLPEDKKLLAELNNTSYGRALRRFLDEEFAKISNVESCSSLDEMLGRKVAIKTIKNLFSFMEEKKTPEKGKNGYI